MKVKIIHQYRDRPLDLSINDFIKDKEVIDIKYSMCAYGGDSFDSALVIYKDSDNWCLIMILHEWSIRWSLERGTMWPMIH